MTTSHLKHEWNLNGNSFNNSHPIIDELPEASKEISAINRYSLFLIVAWLGIVLCSLLWNLHLQNQSNVNFALAEAKSAYTKDMVYRTWVAQHGGVYVVTNEKTPPNPYLSHVPNRDIETVSGLRLTLINPAYMTRQVHELGRDSFGLKAHITSLHLLRPENAPDAWETKALNSLALGHDEYSEVVKENNEGTFRYMKSLHSSPSCMKCHQNKEEMHQANVLGGISVSIPLSRFQNYQASSLYAIIPGHLIFLVLGLLFIIFGNRRLIRYALKTSHAYRDSKEKEHALLYQNNEIILKNRKLDEMHSRILMKNIQLQASNKLTGGILNAVSEDEFFDIIADITLKTLNIPYMAIYSASSAEGMPRTIIQCGKLERDEIIAGQEPCCPISGIRPDNPLQLRNGNCPTHLNSWVWMPLAVGGQTWGWMVFISNKMNVFDSPELLSFLRRFAYQVGAGIQTILLRKHKMAEEEQVIQQNMDLTLLNTTKNRFFSVVAHDLKNPFNVILGLSDILRKGYKSFDEEKMKMIIDNLYESTSKTTHLLDNLLEWGRIQLDELRFEPERQNLKSVVEQSMADVITVARQKGITIINRVPKKLDILADSYIARSVFRNLLSNSVKFSFFGGKVWIDAKTDANWVYCSVTDRGVGIDPGKGMSVFRVDEKVSTMGTFGEKGSGLGLVLCREFIEKHGGTIYLEHPEEGGVKIVFTLPLATNESLRDNQVKQKVGRSACVAI